MVISISLIKWFHNLKYKTESWPWACWEMIHFHSHLKERKDGGVRDECVLMDSVTPALQMFGFWPSCISTSRSEGVYEVCWWWKWSITDRNLGSITLFVVDKHSLSYTTIKFFCSWKIQEVMQILHYFSLMSLNYRSLHDPDLKRTDTETSAVEKQSEVLYKIHRYSSCIFCGALNVFFPF